MNVALASVFSLNHVCMHFYTRVCVHVCAHGGACAYMNVHTHVHDHELRPCIVIAFYSYGLYSYGIYSYGHELRQMCEKACVRGDVWRHVC